MDIVEITTLIANIIAIISAVFIFFSHIRYKFHVLLVLSGIAVMLMYGAFHLFSSESAPTEQVAEIPKELTATLHVKLSGLTREMWQTADTEEEGGLQEVSAERRTENAPVASRPGVRMSTASDSSLLVGESFTVIDRSTGGAVPVEFEIGGFRILKQQVVGEVGNIIMELTGLVDRGDGKVDAATLIGEFPAAKLTGTLERDVTFYGTLQNIKIDLSDYFKSLGDLDFGKVSPRGEEEVEEPLQKGVAPQSAE
jgi:hypothetical protein